MSTIINISAEVAANKEKVWDYYTNPTHITKWNFASDDWQCPHAENDLKVGGKYKARMEAKDGSFGFDFEAEYKEIQPLRKIVYTIADGRKVTITFEEKDNSTIVSTEFEAENTHPVEMQQAGWQAILNNFKKVVESE
ncbi:SRPBCC family protein [Polluticaenibacter yanchengensis]|uniref:SRPBCC family protein n=1 Tax=Polluticaenibacter yanchengensis TaxID=3014562 RepID=A0ABT4UMH9_9BACT|nr:SRPBCC family protein [Chitinophagaceae bacterium LY-5]